MQIKPNPKQTDNLSSPPHGSELSAQMGSGSDGKEITVQTELIQSLLYEILRVKELIRTYNDIPNGGQFNVRVLEELIAAARESLFNYDPVLMKKYYDLLKDCD